MKLHEVTRSRLERGSSHGVRRGHSLSYPDPDRLELAVLCEQKRVFLKGVRSLCLRSKPAAQRIGSRDAQVARL